MFRNYSELKQDWLIIISNGAHPIATRNHRVVGIGDVHILLQSKDEQDDGWGSLSLLQLKNALYVPDLGFNIIAHTKDIGALSYTSVLHKRYGSLCDCNQNPVAAYSTAGDMLKFQRYDLLTRQAIVPVVPIPVYEARHLIYSCRERLASPPVDATTRFDIAGTKKRTYELLERDGTSKKAQNSASDVSETSEEPPYSPAEKLWLRVTYGSVKKFLLIHGLKPFETEHQREGRKMARTIISNRLKVDEAVEETDNEQENLDYSDPRCKFSAKEVDFINERWGNTCSFMQALRYDVCIEGDWKRAKAFVEMNLEN